MRSLVRSLVVALFLGVLGPSVARATWSVIAVDMSTGRIVIASATCVDRDDAFLKGVQAVVVPGKGVAACQAGVDNTHANQMLVFAELQKGTEPEQIIELLSQDPAFQSPAVRHSRSARAEAPATRGSTNGYVTQDIQGRVPGTQIFYSIQGNILRPGEVVPNAVQAFLATQRRDHRPRDGGDGSRRRRAAATAGAPVRRRPTAVRAGDSCDDEDGARRVHPHGRAQRHERRLAQQRQVRDVPHGDPAGPGGPNAITPARISIL